MDEKLDAVGKEDDDINNDGKVDKTDKYLANRRKAVAANIKEDQNNLTPLQQYLYDYEVEISGKDSADEELKNIKKLNNINDVIKYYGGYRGWEVDKDLKYEFANLIKTLKAKNLKEGEDHEVAMAVSSLEAIAEAIVELRQKLGNTERNIPGWIQDHIAKAENYIEQAAQGFHELNQNEMNEELKRIQQLAGVLKENYSIEDDIEQDLMQGEFESVDDQVEYLQSIINFCQNKIAELQANG
jgi:cob(I)alamin adenosyltransferase